MEKLTGKERISRILRHEPVDRIGLYEHFWNDTYKEWIDNQGCPEDFTEEFGFDMDEFWAIRLMARPGFEPIVVAEDEDTITQLDGNWATLRTHKKHDSTPEHVNFYIDDYEKWKTIAKPVLMDESLLEQRIDFEGYRKKKQYCKERDLFFVVSGAHVFEHLAVIAGHVESLAAMIYDPEWVIDMCETYTELILKCQKLLFEREGLPDGVWFYEDMGFKNSPFMSPQMYKQFLYPCHKKTIDYAHSLGLPVIMHSCGFIEPLLDGMVEAGIDCLQVLEVKAGMDLLRVYEKYGDRIAIQGGIDVRELYTNDLARIDAELESKIPKVMDKNCFILHSDHSIPKTVNYEVYKYFIKKGLELGTYK